MLADVVATLDLPPAAYVGNSVGGFAAARLAITDPQRVSRLVLVNSGGFIAGPAANLYCRMLGMPAVMKRVLPRFVRSYMKATSENDHAVQERVLAQANTGAESCYGRIVAQFRQSRIRPAATRRAHHSAMPGHLGIEDTAIPMRFGRATAAAIAGSRLEVLPTGHMPFSSDPAGFLAIAAPFLAAARGSVQ